MITMIVRVGAVICKISQKIHKSCVVLMVMFQYQALTFHGQIRVRLSVDTSKQMENLVLATYFARVEFVWTASVHQAR